MIQVSRLPQLATDSMTFRPTVFFFCADLETRTLTSATNVALFHVSLTVPELDLKLRNPNKIKPDLAYMKSLVRILTYNSGV